MFNVLVILEKVRKAFLSPRTARLKISSLNPLQDFLCLSLDILVHLQIKMMLSWLEIAIYTIKLAAELENCVHFIIYIC